MDSIRLFRCRAMRLVKWHGSCLRIVTSSANLFSIPGESRERRIEPFGESAARNGSMNGGPRDKRHEKTAKIPLPATVAWSARLVKACRRRAAQNLLLQYACRTRSHRQQATNAFFAAESRTTSSRRSQGAASTPITNTRPSSYSTTSAIQTNHDAARTGTPGQRLMFLGSSCIFPEARPAADEGTPHRPAGPTNRPTRWQIARHRDVLELQPPVRNTAVMPTNLYGRVTTTTGTAAGSPGADPQVPRAKGAKAP